MKKPDNCCDVGTFQHQIHMPINGRVECIDFCISDIVAALNGANLVTTFSCCGHGKKRAYIRLTDGRGLIIEPKNAYYETKEEFKKLLELNTKAT